MKARGCSHLHARPRSEPGGPANRRSIASRRLILISLFCVCAGISAHATVTLVSIQSPGVSGSRTSPVNSPVHFEATAESDLHITGYVVYVDDRNVYQTMGPALDTWVILPPDTTHFVYVRAWDASGSFLASPAYWIRVTGLVPPIPPANATRITNLVAPPWMHLLRGWLTTRVTWAGSATMGSSEPLPTALTPIPGMRPTWPISDSTGWSTASVSTTIVSSTGSMCLVGFPRAQISFGTLWFYIPTTTDAATVQAIEFDLFQTVRFEDGVHEFMFGSQCHYRDNQWQLWLPQNGALTWVNTGLSPCQFQTGACTT